MTLRYSRAYTISMTIKRSRKIITDTSSILVPKTRPAPTRTQFVACRVDKAELDLAKQHLYRSGGSVTGLMRDVIKQYADAERAITNKDK